MSKLEVETGLKEGEWRKSVTKQRYVKSNLPLRKTQDNTRNWKILSNAISSSLIRITKLEILNNCPLKWEIINTTNKFSCSTEPDLDGMKASREL